MAAKGIVVAVFAIGGLATMCGGGDSDSSSDGLGAQSACEDWVEDQLKSPSTADFNDQEISGTGPWTVTGTVDAENSFGAMIRADWTCDVRLDSDDFYRGNATLLE